MRGELVQLGDCINIKHGYPFESEYFSFDQGKYIVLTPGNFLEQGGFISRPDKDRYYNHEIPKGFLLAKGDLVVAMTEQTYGLLGSPAIIPQDGKFLHNQRLGLVKITDKERIDKKYLYYSLFQKRIREEISSSASGTKIRHTSPDRIRSCRINLPSLQAQRKIAAILSAYDDLIEVNERRIEVLEKMAEELYREWFVRMRFPGHESTNKTNGIPDGWEIGVVADMSSSIITGKTPSTENRNFYNGQIPFIKTPDMHGHMFITSTGEALTQEGAASQKHQTIPQGTICVSCIGTGGIVSISTQESQTNQQINSVILRTGEYLEWAFFCLQNLKPVIELFGGTGSTMTNLSKGKFEKLPIIIPSKPLIISFHECASPLFSQILGLELQNSKLSSTRDRLLGRLMSGALDVEELDIAFPPSMAAELAAQS